MAFAQRLPPEPLGNETEAAESSERRIVPPSSLADTITTGISG